MEGGRSVIVATLVVVAVAGTAGGVTIQSFPQTVTLSSTGVANDNAVSVDEYRAQFNGSSVDGYNVTVRNDGSSNLNTNVTVRLKTVDGTVVASASKEGTVLTGERIQLQVWFDGAYAHHEYAWIEVEVSTSAV